MVFGVEILGWTLFWALAYGGVVGAVVNFSLNRYWTFRDKDVAYRSSLWSQVLKFAMTVVGSILLKYLGTYVLEHYAGIDYKIGKLISLGTLQLHLTAPLGFPQGKVLSCYQTFLLE